MNSFLTLENLSLIYPEQLLLEFSVAEREIAWQQVKSQKYANSNASWNAFLNLLCLNTFLAYLNTEADLRNKAKLLIEEADLPSIWQVVNGTIIEIDGTKLVLIPSESSEFSELQVSREWVDIVTWRGDYYLAIELFLEERFIRVCGYTTYQQLQAEGRYDSLTETYSLEVEELIEDLTILWTMQNINSNRMLETGTEQILTTNEVEKLLDKLSEPSPYSPRLNVPFEQWKVIVANEHYRNKLYELQHQKSKIESDFVAVNTTNLGRWLQNTFEFGWQSINTLVNSQAENLVYSFRQKRIDFEGIVVEGTKIIALGDRLLVLSIGLKPDVDESISVFVQLFSRENESCLPPNLKLILLSKQKKNLQEVQTREQDSLIQLKRFVCRKGKQFSIQVSLGELAILENFAIE